MRKLLGGRYTSPRPGPAPSNSKRLLSAGSLTGFVYVRWTLVRMPRLSHSLLQSRLAKGMRSYSAHPQQQLSLSLGANEQIPFELNDLVHLAAR